MSYYDKNYKILLELYTAVYKELGFNFSEIDKVDSFFMNYKMDEARQKEIVDEVLSKHKLSKWAKNGIETAYWLGVAPTGTNSIYSRDKDEINGIIKADGNI